MKSQARQSPPEGWNEAACNALIDELWSLRKAMVAQEVRWMPGLETLPAVQQPSAVNLVHYLAMRRRDLRPLQQRLAGLGVSSLGRAETHVLANVDKVLGILHRLAGRPWAPLLDDEPAGRVGGGARLSSHAQALFGPPPKGRAVRIMVTLPSEAAHDEALLPGLVHAGMDIARINCAHDGPAEWAAMAAGVRKAADRAGRAVRILMDLGGPKLRTGPIAAGAAVVKLKPVRDALGVVTAPARLVLRPAGLPAAPPGGVPCLSVDAAWFERLALGDRIDLTDARGSRRHLRVVECGAGGVIVECQRTTYLTGETSLRLHRRGHDALRTLLGEVPTQPGQLHLQRGEILNLEPGGVGRNAVPATPGSRARRASIACTLPEALARVRKGERVWFDDGRIGGVVRREGGTRVEVEITDARDGGETLAADKGINLPDSRLDLPALTPQDLEDLRSVVLHADIVGLSFAQSAGDVTTLRQRLAELDAAHLGLMLKIETRRGFAHLPELLLAAMAAPAAGVMIARGDLAVECGYERMAEVQEEILWACEAAHMPVVWATQVLETLAKTGLPSRAEITDAAMGGRAECVMLNKGPHILDAMRTLDDILVRMQAHQSKKRPLLRALKSWALAAEPSLEPAAVTPVPQPTEGAAAA